METRPAVVTRFDAVAATATRPYSEGEADSPL